MGGWAPATVELLDASRLPDRTQGEIPDDSISGNRGKMQGATGAATATDRQATDEILVTGRDALQYLPHEIRLGVSQAIPSPEFHVGGAVRWTDTQGQISRHEVNLMAMQGQRAVVVMASTQGRSGWWQADQITYDFVRPVGEALPGVTAAGAIGR
ncbi:hypothetical protein EDL96_12355 [Kocuria soli]|uniref:Uncharacterized protein n=1 Tax=Kocuria soli TaxID=2485125 RepID=A0A3N4A8D4_9MICC|nr:hypothetical protein EDL96_12355 [Kocuria soli]